jgi:hypothetical protein
MDWELCPELIYCLIALDPGMVFKNSHERYQKLNYWGYIGKKANNNSKVDRAIILSMYAVGSITCFLIIFSRIIPQI